MSDTGFSSNAEELRYFAKQLLEDGQAHTIQEIKDYVERYSEHSQDFTVGMYSGAIRSLVQNSNGKYKSVARGRYQMVNMEKAAPEGEQLRDKVVQILDDVCEKLEEACTVNIMKIEESDLRVAQKTSELIQMLRQEQVEIKQLQ